MLSSAWCVKIWELPGRSTIDSMEYVPRVLVDFDNTIQIPEGKYPNTGKPIPGALQAIKSLRKMGYEVIIFTARTDFKVVEDWLKDNGFPALEVTNKKYPAIAYIDDRAIPFRNNWSQIIERIKNVKDRP